MLFRSLARASAGRRPGQWSPARLQIAKRHTKGAVPAVVQGRVSLADPHPRRRMKRRDLPPLVVETAVGDGGWWWRWSKRGSGAAVVLDDRDETVSSPYPDRKGWASSVAERPDRLQPNALYEQEKKKRSKRKKKENWHEPRTHGSGLSSFGLLPSIFRIF